MLGILILPDLSSSTAIMALMNTVISDTAMIKSIVFFELQKNLIMDLYKLFTYSWPSTITCVLAHGLY
jgi:hypothetical protein